jgi:hypothetical protein
MSDGNGATYEEEEAEEGSGGNDKDYAADVPAEEDDEAAEPHFAVTSAGDEGEEMMQAADGQQADASISLGVPKKKKKSGITLGKKPVFAPSEGQTVADGMLVTPGVMVKTKKNASASDGASGSAALKEKKGKGTSSSADGEVKKRKGPIAPSAFMLWAKVNRPEIVASDPGLNFADVGRKVS